VTEGQPLGREFFARPVLEVAPDLLGALVRSGPVVVRLTEVEAYAGTSDPGSHAYRGMTPRTRVMFGPAALSPQTRGKSDLKERAARLEAYEAWMPPTRVNFEELAGDAWDEHWRNHAEIIRLMRSAEDTARAIRERVKAGYQAEN